MNERDIALPPELEEYRGAAHDLHRLYSRLITPTFDADDLASVITQAFVEAKESFDFSKSNNRSFLGWLYYVARQRIFAAYRHMGGPVTSCPTHESNKQATVVKQKQAMFRQSLDEIIPGTNVCRLDILVYPDDIPVPDRVEQLLNPSGADEALLAILDAYVFPSERKLLFEFFGIPPYEKKDQKTMAQEHGCSRQWINYKIGLAVKRLRKVQGLRNRLHAKGFFRNGKRWCSHSPQEVRSLRDRQREAARQESQEVTTAAIGGGD